ncbi:MAG: hypothetical protein NT029_20750 [Armatimonadetes bacterium]|nr:hypothetical protein [Armatimonadota bacterium]
MRGWVFMALLPAMALLGTGRAAAEVNLVANGEFRELDAGKPAAWEMSGDARSVSQTLTVGAQGGRSFGQLTCTRFSPDGPASHAMVAQVGHVRLTEGTAYEFSCRARQQGIRGRSISVAVSDMSDWSNCGLSKSLQVGAEWRAYRVVFRATRAVERTGRLQIWFNETGTLDLTEVAIVEAASTSVAFTDTTPPARGRNLIPNGSFELGGARWSSYGVSAGWGNLAHLHGSVVTGREPGHPHFLRIPMGPGVTPKLAFDYFRPTSAPQTHLQACGIGWIPVRAGQTYTLSCDMRATVPGTPGRLGYTALAPAGSQWDTRQDGRQVQLTTAWVRYTFAFQAQKSHLFVLAGPDLAQDARVDVDLDNLQLEAGPEATRWEAFSTVQAALESTRPMGVFVAGEPVVLTARLAGSGVAPDGVRLSLKAVTAFDRTIALPSVVMKPGVPVRVAMPKLGAGWYRIEAAAPPGVVLLTPSVRIAVVPRLGKQETLFGLNHAFPDAGLIDQASLCGVSWYRDWSLKWDHIEPSQGSYRWGIADEQIGSVLQRGPRVMALLPPFPSAEWSSEAPAALRKPGYPGERARQAYAPRDPALLADFAGRAVARYKDRIRVWEFLNEPIYTDYSLPREAYKPADYVALLKPVAAAARKADPACRIMGGAGAGPGGITSQMIQAGLLGQIDILNLHIYPGARAPEGFIDEMDQLLAEMDRHGGRKPIWITEFSYYGADDLPRKPFVPTGGDWAEERLLTDERECAEYTVRFAAVMLARGVEKVFIHSGSSGAANMPNFECCLFGQGGAPRKVAAAVAVMAATLGPKPTPQKMPALPEGVYAAPFETGSASVVMAWATQGAWSIRVPPGVRCVDMVGAPVHDLRPALSGSPIYLIGKPGSRAQLSQAVAKAVAGPAGTAR